MTLLSLGGGVWRTIAGHVRRLEAMENFFKSGVPWPATVDSILPYLVFSGGGRLRHHGCTLCGRELQLALEEASVASFGQSSSGGTSFARTRG